MSLINQVLENVEKRQGHLAAGTGAASQPVRPVLAQERLHKNRSSMWWMGLGLMGVVAMWLLYPGLAQYRAQTTRLASLAQLPTAAGLHPPQVGTLPSVSQKDSRFTHFLFSAWQDASPTLNAAQSEPHQAQAGHHASPHLVQETFPASATPANQLPSPALAKREATEASPALTSVAAVDKQAVTKHIKPEQEVNVLIQRAVDAEQKGRMSEALALSRQAVASFPQVEDARLLLVNYLQDAKLESEALNHLQAGVRAYPEQGNVRKALAKWQLGHGQAAEALETLQPMAVNAAQDLDWQWMQAMAHQQLGQHALAVPYFERAIQLQPTQAQAYVAYAVSLQALGQRAQALQQLRLAQDFPMSDRMTEFVLQRTQQLSQAIER